MNQNNRLAHLGWPARIDNLCASRHVRRDMATVSMNVSLTKELRAFVERRVKSGRYGNSSDVIRAGLRALNREEVGQSWREWQELVAKLPNDPIAPEIEQEIVEAVRRGRRADRRRASP
jgi:antitoxin ParD1/3/4